MALRTFSVIVLVLLVTTICVTGDDWFPITAWGIRHGASSETSWVADVDTAWNGNAIKSSWGTDSSTTRAFLTAGRAHNIKFIMGNMRNSLSDTIPTLTYMARGQFSIYESEEHNPNSITGWPPAHGYFVEDFCIGDTITDPEASNNKAWKASVASDTAGYMQMALRQHADHRQEYTDKGPGYRLYYQARFSLKIPNTDGQEDDPVCRLEAWRDTSGSGHYCLLDSHLVRRTHFSDTTTYDTFNLWFKKDTTMAKTFDYKDYRGYKDNHRMDYRIWWFDNYDLYADKVELRDTLFWNLERGGYDTEIYNIVYRWDPDSALAYYYLWDEPKLDQFKAFVEVQQNSPVGVRIIPQLGPDLFPS